MWQQELELTAAEQRLFERVGAPLFYFPVEIAYATVHKQREGGRVVAVTERVVLGTPEQLEQTLDQAERSRSINTSFVERWFGTQRQFNGRKKRRAYTFSKELSQHEACTWLVVLWYNFAWCVRTLRQKVQEDPPRYHYRTPAMAAGLTDHPWSMAELLTHPLYRPKDAPLTTSPRTYNDVLERLQGALPTGPPLP